MKKAIVTGATGFIGKFLVRELVKQNVEVIAVVRRGTKNLNTINALPVKIVECNIADYHMLPDMIADRDIDVVFHIAWQGVSDLDARNEAIQMQNLQSTLDLIDAMHIMKIGCFIGCGSMHEAESLVEMNEDKVISNLGYMYKATKTAAHWIGKAKCGTYGIRFFWPLINTYGEEERSARLVNTIIRKVLGIYLILIPLKRFIDNSSNREICIFTAILIIGNFVIPTINIAFGTKIENYMLFTQYVTYVLLGYIIGGLHAEDNGREKKAIDIITNRGGIQLGLWLFASVIKIIIQYAAVMRCGEGSALILGDRIFTMIQALSVFCLFKKYMDGVHAGKLAKSISRCSENFYWKEHSEILDIE